ncbi:helix-turn-helix domain-containing protein [Falsibacillus pallidus]|uniref:Uncharacterized protein YpbB n=1 Tax=Falsibacillus pallidus TaxID=493781 RepID=A0A370GKS9_9BACI|nr:helix-turn-helix domain-containing protein [Falsibacillus pallidus]RDI42954.1 uncharacterized protein YpbB [Falsibacillus pallidus]
MTFFQALIVKSLMAVRDERTVYSVYHILKGKKSSQSIQDAHLYSLQHLFQLYPTLTRNEFDSELKKLQNDKSIIINEDNSCRVLDAGKSAVQETFRNLDLPIYVEGWKQQDIAITFWKRTSLLVQVMSHLTRRQTHYYPIRRETELLLWVKDFFNRTKFSRDELARKAFEELQKMLSGQNFENPYVFVLRLTGANRIGFTAKQAADELNMEQTEYEFRFMNLLHFMIGKMNEEQDQFPLLSSILSGMDKHLSLTNSARTTYQYLLKGKNLDEIAASRGLKLSTIEDHIIEIALNVPGFEIAPYVSEEERHSIAEQLIKTGQKKLKPIRDAVPSATYFQIRLVLAQQGGTA